MVRRFLRRLRRDEKGQGMLEYGIILAIIAVAAVAFTQTIGSSQNSAGNTVGTQITNSVSNPSL